LARSPSPFRRMPNGCGKSCALTTTSMSGFARREGGAGAFWPGMGGEGVRGGGGGRISPVYGEKSAKALLYKLRAQQFTDRVLLGWARSTATAHDSEWHALATLPQRWTAPVFPLKAADFMKRGVAQGPALGAAIAAAEQAWIAAGFSEDRRALDGIADAATNAGR